LLTFTTGFLHGRAVRHKGCEKTFATWKRKLEMCNADIKKMESEAEAEISVLEARIDYNDCRIEELNEEWGEVNDEMYTGNPDLHDSLLLSMPSNHSQSLVVNEESLLLAKRSSPPPYDDPLEHEYYYGDQGPVADPECVCVKGIDQCDCVVTCRNLFNSCAARYKSTRLHLYQRWKKAKKRIAWQEARINSLEQGIMRTRAADEAKDTDGKMRHSIAFHIHGTDTPSHRSRRHLSRILT